MRYLLAGILLAGAAVLAGCGASRTDQERVLKVLQVRTTALNGRDLSLYRSIISPQYHDKGKDAATLRDDIAAGFRTYDSISYQPHDTRVRIDGARAEATGSYRMKISVHGREMVLDGTERIVLVRETGGWKIIAGL